MTKRGTRLPEPDPASSTNTPLRAPTVPTSATRPPSADHARIRSITRTSPPSPTVTGPPIPFHPSRVPVPDEGWLLQVGAECGVSRNADGGLAEITPIPSNIRWGTPTEPVR